MIDLVLNVLIPGNQSNQLIAGVLFTLVWILKRAHRLVAFVILLKTDEAERVVGLARVGERGQLVRDGERLLCRMVYLCLVYLQVCLLLLRGQIFGVLLLLLRTTFKII